MNAKVILIIIILFLIPCKYFYTKFVEINMCIDIGICTEGIKTKIDGDLIEINEENCKRYNRIWIEETKSCKLK